MINDEFIESRYGPDSGISIERGPREFIDLDPSRIFADDSREVLKDLEAKGWPNRRLISLICAAPSVLSQDGGTVSGDQIFVPTSANGDASSRPPDTKATGRVLAVQLDDERVLAPFLVAWLNSEAGIMSRQRSLEASSTGTLPKALRSDPRSLMSWADELIVPLPEPSVQRRLASADERLGSFQAELSTQRESMWSAPENIDEILNRFSRAFDDSLSSWLEDLPFPIASALWTARAASSPGEQQRAYLHAWEAIVTFHATVLLSANRSDVGNSAELEGSISETLKDQNLGIERSTFGTWVVITERTSKELRTALARGDADEAARIRRAFGDLSRTAIERLASKGIVTKFKEVNAKRNSWLGHNGYTSDDEYRAQVQSLVSDLRDLRQLLGSVWTQLLLVRAGSARRGRDGLVQSAEVAIGTRSPFATQDFSVGDLMIDGELYLVRDGSESPLRLVQFVQLRAAPQHAHYTTYFYNRTDGIRVRMISYQHGSESELQDDLEGFRHEFGALNRNALENNAGVE
ncbi:hypothetical protein [Tessaracoccus sp. MC1865]|uniref:hypothetical protein n=1 Tax=Tessaracoccus sp. MC1865 TaxID=2760310 RepID=UPI001FD739C9|nr:hypothetical protein [Tessaracoccus sp. MC1865]